MTQTHQSVDDFLAGGGYVSAKFPTVGTLHKGTVIEASLQQQRTMDGKPKFWDSDGSPMMQARIVIQTDERDPNVQDDDGVRALYVKGESQKAVRAAVQKAKAKSIEPGGMLAIKYVGDGKAEGNLNPPKLYVAEYRPPVKGLDENLLGGNGAAPAAPAQAPAAAAPEAPAPTSGVTEEDLFG